MESLGEMTGEQRMEGTETPMDLKGIVHLAAKVRDLRQEAPAAWELARGLEWATAEIQRLTSGIKDLVGVGERAIAQRDSAEMERDELRERVSYWTGQFATSSSERDSMDRSRVDAIHARDEALAKVGRLEEQAQLAAPLLSALLAVDPQTLPEPIAKLVVAWRASSKT